MYKIVRKKYIANVIITEFRFMYSDGYVRVVSRSSKHGSRPGVARAHVESA